MSDKKILKAAIEKAEKNGFTPSVKMKNHAHKAFDFAFSEPEYVLELPYYTIFNHDFAKAFWGETEATLAWYAENLDERPYSFEKGFTWQVHLMRMVLEENPIQYLAKFV